MRWYLDQQSTVSARLEDLQSEAGNDTTSDENITNVDEGFQLVKSKGLTRKQAPSPACESPLRDYQDGEVASEVK